MLLERPLKRSKVPTAGWWLLSNPPPMPGLPPPSGLTLIAALHTLNYCYKRFHCLFCEVWDYSKSKQGEKQVTVYLFLVTLKSHSQIIEHWTSNSSLIYTAHFTVFSPWPRWYQKPWKVYLGVGKTHLKKLFASDMQWLRQHWQWLGADWIE